MAIFEFSYDYIFSGYTWSITREHDLSEEESESIKIGEWIDDDSDLAKTLLEIFKEQKLDDELELFMDEIDQKEHEGLDKEFSKIQKKDGIITDADLEICKEWEKDRWSRYINKKIVRVA